jgi:hypothetical protein
MPPFGATCGYRACLQPLRPASPAGLCDTAPLVALELCQLLLLTSTCRHLSPGESFRRHGSLRPLARSGPTGTLPTDSRAISGPSTRDTARAWWGRAQGHRALRRRPPREASWGVGVAQVRPGCVPASVPPSPARPTMKGRVVPGGVCPAALGLAPRASCGATFGGRQSETWPGGFAQAGQSRGPGTDRPGSSTRALLPRPRGTPGGGTFATRPRVPKAPLVRVTWGHRCRVVCPLGARAVLGPQPRRPTSESPGFAPHRPRLARGSPGNRGGCFGPRASHVVPNSERMLRAVLGDSCTPLPRPSSDRAPALPSPGLQASGPSRCEPEFGGLFRGGPVAAVMRVGGVDH